MTSNSSGQFSQLDQLVDEFAERYRRGDRPTLQEYIDRHPHLADGIREFFPAVVETEQVEGDRVAPAEPSLPLKKVGDYLVLREIGRGGMGIVYEAEQQSLGRRVALKVLPASVSQDEKALERFRRESKAAAKLHHTNIVPVFEVGQDGDVCFYAMQFIQGLPLDEVIDELQRLRQATGGRQPPVSDPQQGADAPRSPGCRRAAESLLTGRFQVQALASPATVAESTPPDGSTSKVRSAPGTAVLTGQTDLSSVEANRQPYYHSVARIGQQVAHALAHAHQRGIIHRDIKPSNLLLDATGVVWVTDFGLAKTEESSLTETGEILGTLRYLAPERFRSECDVRSDVYALGLTLYELLVLRPAFEASDRLGLIERIYTQEPPRPRALDPNIPRDLETIILKAIAKDPARRYSSAEVLGEDLRRFLNGEPIRARRVGELERAWLWAKRRPAVAGLLAGMVLAVLVGSAVSILFGVEAVKQAEDARSRQRQAEENERQADEARKKVEVTLAQSLARPLFQEGPLNEAERDALWDLARSDNDRVRLLCIEKALEEPATAERLSRRGEQAALASVGLDLHRREQVLALLLSRLQDGSEGREVKEACVSLGVALGCQDEAFLRTATGTVLEAIKRETNPLTLARHTRLMMMLARNLRPEQAAAAFAQFFAAIARADPRAQDALGQAARELAEQLGPKEAAVAFAHGLGSPALKHSHLTAIAMVPTMTALARRLGREEASVAATQVLAVLDKTSDPLVLGDLGQVLAAVLEPLTLAETAQASAAAAPKIGVALEKDELGYEVGYKFDSLGRALAALSGRFSSEEAAALINRAINALVSNNCKYSLPDFNRGVVALAERLTPHQADAALQKALEALGKTTNNYTHQSLGPIMTALAGRLASGDAAAAVSKALDALARTTHPFVVTGYGGGSYRMGVRDLKGRTTGNETFDALVRTVAALAGRLSAEERARASRTALTLVQGSLAQTNDVRIRRHLFLAVAVLARHLTPKDLATARRSIDLTGERKPSGMALQIGLTTALLLGRTNPRAAFMMGSLVKGAHHSLTGPTTVSPDLLNDYARAVAMLPEPPGPETAQVSVAAHLVLDGMKSMSRADAWADPVVQQNQGMMLGAHGESLATLARWLPPEEAARVSAAGLTIVSQALVRTTEPNALENLGQAIAALADGVGPEEAAETAPKVLDALSRTVETSALERLNQAAAKLAGRSSNQGLVDLLKSPTCTGEARTIVLKELGRRFHRRFDDLWDFVDWSRAHQPELDLASPPRRSPR